ncbi:polysaccharide deacetylase [Clostridium tetani]|uniref:Polysaccharide deacetylase n=1 Tax=Clostridium tetani TaxID=1513 RepID=A0A4Q0VA82_CLOTA|nr:polysaccharide deacetylase family protein [Clostridium tetani]RXI46147.1 polysaccharide deacetylase [Clostridium tetani]BDR66351.1 hypothetical protein K144312032_05790 [Clostridium tetani]
MKQDKDYGRNLYSDNRRKSRIKRRKRTTFLLAILLIFASGMWIKNSIDKKKILSHNEKTQEETIVDKKKNNDEKLEKEEKKEEIKVEKKENIYKNDKKVDKGIIVGQDGLKRNENNTIVMTVDEIWKNEDKKKIAFLTFDDGPSEYTPQILDILKKYNIKSTFFVLGTSVDSYSQYLKREVEEGHAIGNHTYNHNIKYFGNYTPQSFVQDVKKCDDSIRRVLGQDFKTNLVRFPGGSFNHKSYENELLKAGFKHIDWNIENGDARRLNVPKEELLNNVKRDMANHNHLVILMHDSATKKTTVESLPELIEHLKSQGFEFGIISQNN